jgi:hypothetical protein
MRTNDIAASIPQVALLLENSSRTGNRKDGILTKQIPGAVLVVGGVTLGFAISGRGCRGHIYLQTKLLCSKNKLHRGPLCATGERQMFSFRSKTKCCRTMNRWGSS